MYRSYFCIYSRFRDAYSIDITWPTHAELSVYSYLVNLNKLLHEPIKCQFCSHIETSQLTCTANQLTGFYMRATLALNGLISKGDISISVILIWNWFHSIFVKKNVHVVTHELDIQFKWHSTLFYLKAQLKLSFWKITSVPHLKC